MGVMSHSAPHTDGRSSDAALIELLRVEASLGIGHMAEALGVTATANRQRLDRLMRQGIICRETVASSAAHAAHGQSRRSGRGRPAHVYSLTEKGRRTSGDNFRDLSLVLWREIRQVRDPAIRQGLIARVGSAMAGMYRDRMTGDTAAERLESVAHLLRERRLSCDVQPGDAEGGLPVLTAYACPYPELAEQDRGICAAERIMLQELVGSSVQLSECRLDGAACCKFTATGQGLANTPVEASNAVRLMPQLTQQEERNGASR
ncbi:MAG: helix-turn-helix transcriptional regulator [Planctomycetia bacterium]